MTITNYNIFSDDVRKFGIEYAIDHSAKLGFDSVEFIDFRNSPDPILPDFIDPEKTNALLAGNGLTVACYSYCSDLIAPDYEEQKPILFRHIELAGKLNCPFFHHTLVPLLTLPENAPSYDEIFETVVTRACEIADYAKKFNITCLYEPQGMYFNGTEGLGKFFREMKKRRDNVGICGDSGNSLFADVCPTDIFREFIDDIKHVHVKDYLVNTVSEKNPERFYSIGGKEIVDTEIGTGVVDFDACFDYLNKANYNSAVSFEINFDDETVRKSIEFIKKYF